MALPTVVFRRRPLEEAALLEVTQDPAEIARVQPEIAAKLGGRGPLAVRQLVEHAHLAEGEGALEVPLLEQADLPRVEAVEAPHGGHARIEVLVSHICVRVT
jgi:hypothetical protein